MNTVYLPLDKIRLDPELQPRVQLDQAHVQDCADAVRAGANLPPAIVYHDGQNYWLSSGWHRFFGTRQAGGKNLLCEVRRGSKRDAYLCSLGSNATHGLKRTQADIRQAINRMLDDEEWGQWPSEKIAQHLQVRVALVLALKAERLAAPTLPFDQPPSARADEPAGGSANTDPLTSPARGAGQPVATPSGRAVDRLGDNEEDRLHYREQLKRTVRKLWRQAEGAGEDPFEAVERYKPVDGRRKKC